jgi:hypothetical protein
MEVCILKFAGTGGMTGYLIDSLVGRAAAN